MTKHDLKELAVIGAELGAAKAENEKLRAEVEALRVALLGIASVNPAERGIEWAKSYASDGLKGAGSELYARWLETFKEAEALRKDADRRAALSQQAESEELDYSYHSHEFAKAQPEPTDTFTAVEMATAAAQGFRDGQAAVEQAAAQDEQQPYMWVRVENDYIEDYTQDANLAEIWLTEDWPVTMPLYAAPIAQTALQLEQSRPANKLRALAEIWDQNADEADEFGNAQAAEALRLAAFELRATLSAPLGKFRMGDLVKKSTGSEWVGHVCGWYSTNQTPEGYAVESSAHRNSVQIYPVTALEAVE